MIENAVLIAGPTASGKSAAALDLARREDRVIVNADSMQVYRGLRILSAAPSEGELAQAPHRLYGHVDPAQDYSVGAWLRDVERLRSQGAFAERPPIFVGGTGLYFQALCGGLSPMPEIPREVRERWRRQFAAEGAEALHRLLRSVDPAAAESLKPSDGQRLVRALEVFEATGRSLLHWQAKSGAPVIDAATARKFLLQPERSQLTARIDARFYGMVEEGAVEEAKRIGILELPPAAPAAKAIGLRELLAAERGEITLDEAVMRAKAASRQYAKRQTTWFRNRLGTEWQRLSAWSSAT